MKRLLLFFVCLISVGYVHAVDSTVVKGTQERILDELIEIRTVQDSTYVQRMRAFEARNSNEALPSEYSVLSMIKGNTDKDHLRDGWNVYGWIAFVISLLSLIISLITSIAQWYTTKHTKNAPLSAQKGKLADLPRHFYRNIVCSSAIIFKYLDKENGESGNRKSYPSESNLLKLQTLPDDIFLPIDIDEKSYEKMHELRLLFRNYNVEVKIASEHLSRQHLTDDSLSGDFDNLLFKPLHLTQEAFGYEKDLFNDVVDQNRNAVEKMINEHFLKLMSNLYVLMRSEHNEYLKRLLSHDFKCIEESIDKKGALRRSMKGLSKITISNKDELIRICKDSKNGDNTPRLQKFIKKLIAGSTDFIEWFNVNYDLTNKKVDITVEQLCESLQPYFEYLARDTWDFETLFYYMLAVDVAIETDRIGMINY